MKVFVQVIDTRTGVYQTGMIEENVIKGKEIENALLHFGVSDIKWKPANQIENANNYFGEVTNTTKVVSAITLC